MRVKELKEFLEELPNDLEITVSDGKGYLVDIISVSRTITIDRKYKVDTHVVVLYPARANEEVEG